MRAQTKGKLLVGGTQVTGIPRHARVRVYEVIRTAHLERAHEFAAASILFAERRYDFDESLTSGLDLQQCSLRGLAVALLRRPVAAIEVNEPLMRSGLPRAVVALVAVRLRGLLTTRRCLVVSYAIANLDEFQRPLPRWRSYLRKWRDNVLARVLARGLDRIAFGTPGSRDLYARLLGRQLAGTSTALVPALPSPCSCPEESTDPQSVVFVGAFDDRKGVRALIDAWPAVTSALPRAHLHILGKGQHEGVVREFVTRTPSASLAVDPPREQIHRALQQAAVLVLFSVRTPLWREQVGLPIVEGLAHGCRIVSSDETGLADWLVEHGHTVIPQDASATRLAEAISAALTTGPPAESILSSLPQVDGRHAADTWLFAPLSATDERP